MFRIAHLSIKSRLILMLMIVSLLAIIVIGVLGWRNGQTSLNDAIVNNLTSVRSSKAYQIERYFDVIFSHTRTLAEDRMVVNAMNEFKEGYQVGVYRSTAPEELQAIADYYEDGFLSRLSDNLGEPALSVLYRPRRPVANYFQYHYIVNNPFPIGEKEKMAASENDSTIYNRFHQFYHPLFRNLVDEFNYYDLFLIDLETGNIVYSVFKEADFATSLREGPYRESGLGVLAAQIRQEPERGRISIVDFRAYDPSYAAPAAFVGTPIFDRTQAVGILAIQLPLDEINRVMTGDRDWERDGLGLTGESYLVGADQLLRSDSRFYLEDKQAYNVDMQLAGVSAETLARIDRFDTSVLLQPVTTDAVELAFDTQRGTDIINGYRNIPVLSSYAPINIPGLNWIILSEIETAEAFAPITMLQRNILIWGVGFIMLVGFVSIILSQRFLRPIDKLTEGAKKLSEGETDVYIDVTTDDEFGNLASSFNAMAESKRTQEQIIAEKNSENERLLLNILPASLAKRLTAGERIADQLQQVSVIYIRLQGFAQMSARLGALVSAEYLEELIELLDEAAERHLIDRVRTIGETYIAACGITTARLDHAKRIVDFANVALNIIKRFDVQHDEHLSVQIGINSGPVIVGVVGTRRFDFELWGETVNVAQRIHLEADPNHVLVTEQVIQRVSEHFHFEQHSILDPEEDATVVYALKQDKPQPTIIQGA